MTRQIQDFIESQTGSFEKEAPEPLWGRPVVGFSSAADPLYQFFRKDIGDFYLTPAEILAPHIDPIEARLEDVTVISWVLPHTETNKAGMRNETYFPTKRQRWLGLGQIGHDTGVTRQHHLSIGTENRSCHQTDPKQTGKQRNCDRPHPMRILFLRQTHSPQ